MNLKDLLNKAECIVKWDQLEDFYNELYDDGNTDWIFRGQSCSDFPSSCLV